MFRHLPYFADLKMDLRQREYYNSDLWRGWFDHKDTRRAQVPCEGNIPTARYQRKREVPNITGFVVNIHDATNFDIDLELPESVREEYTDVICKSYSYINISCPLTCANEHGPGEMYYGRAYRCRLQGIGISRHGDKRPSNYHVYKSNQMIREVRKIIDRNDGWVTCTLSDIDVYQRLLVDISVMVGNVKVDLKDYLLGKMEREEYPIFYRYINCKGRRCFQLKPELRAEDPCNKNEVDKDEKKQEVGT